MARVFAAGYGRMQRCFSNAQPYLGDVALLCSLEFSNHDLQVLTIILLWLSYRNRDIRSGFRHGTGNRSVGVTFVAADKTGASVDHEFRRIDAVITEAERVGLLPLCPLPRRKWINPALMVPIIDVLFESYDLRPCYRLIFFELCKQTVCGRAARAAFGCKQFQNDGHPDASDGCGANWLLRNSPLGNGSQEEN